MRSGSAPAVRSRPLLRRRRLWLWVHRSLDRWLSPLGVWFMHRTRGSLARRLKVNALLLTTTGRRSGRERTVVLQFFPDGDAMVVVAANDGSGSHPGWYHNLMSTPEARVEVAGTVTPVRARELGTEDAAGWWERILEASPEYEWYRRATERRFPILRLVPATSGGRASTRRCRPQRRN